MGVLWHKIGFDIWHSKVRTLLVVLSIAAGVFAVGAIFGMSDQLLSGMDRAHQSVVPSHVSMYLNRPVERETLLALRRVRGVADIEPANFISTRFKVQADDKWQPSVVVMRDDFQRQVLDIQQLREGPWPTGARLGIERLASQYFHVDISDQVILEIDKRERSFPVVSKIRHPFVPPPQFGGQAYFFMDAEGIEHFGVARGEFSQIMVRVDPYSPALAKEVASEIKDRLGKQGIEVGATMYQDPIKHWGRMFVEGITLVLQVLAVISLVMGVVLVLNTVTAIVTQQTNQIGVLKSIGGTSGTIARLFLVTVLFYGALALVISLPGGLFLAYGASKWFLNLFNIDYETFAFSPLAVGLMAGAALVVPLLAALWPILHAARLTVRADIASYGLGGDFRSGWLDRSVGAAAGRVLPSQYALALANMFRRKARLVLTLLVMVIAGTMFLAVMSLSTSISATLEAEFGRRNYDVLVEFSRPQRSDQAVAVARSLPGVTGAAVSSVHSVRILRQGQQLKEAGVNTNLHGVTLSPAMYTPLIIAGRWLDPEDGRALVMSQDTATDNGIHLGDTVTLDMGQRGESDWQVVGFYKIVFGGGFSNDNLYANLPSVLESVGQGPTGVLAYVTAAPAEAAQVQRLASDLESTYRAFNMKPYVTFTTVSDRQSAESQFAIFIGMLLVLALIVAAVGGIGLMGALSLGVIERTKEIGVMRAIGARSPTLLRMFLLEGLAQGLLSWLLAVPLSWVVSPPLAATLGRVMFSVALDYRYNFRAVGIWLAVMLVIGAMASILPARNAARISVRRSLQYE